MDFPVSAAVAIGAGLLLPHIFWGTLPGTAVLAEAFLAGALVRIVWLAR
ncbi:hypothetical protein Mpop_2718 [Methylorubrum populi BJ001]|jgi:hypothetical protein|uniref:Uncharacterized protein n=1 Tax=Methylorubrum populi (strain ATCC BAA-705 / NCIMB 13946 / BJ001) TaxID=441620 RepID=B1ZD04_METPB|nr:hypothetical protein [Methylorubrum populi]ACB80873.1 hypothetical protein Mpop_2718 [Methylorubrum populi BJ001]